MPLQKVEFEFPDPDKASDKTDFVEKSDGSFALKVEGRASEEEAKREKAKAKAKEDDFDIEVVDDRPDEDQGKKRSKGSYGAFRRGNGRVFREGAKAPATL